MDYYYFYLGCITGKLLGVKNDKEMKMKILCEEREQETKGGV